MKAIRVLNSPRIVSRVKLLVFLLFLILLSCQKDEFERNLFSTDELPVLSLPDVPGAVNYLAPQNYTITSKSGLYAMQKLDNPDFEYFNNFFITVLNGDGGKTKVQKLAILIDGRTVITYADFRRNSRVAKKDIVINSESTLEIKLEGSRGRFITVRIDCYPKSTTISDIDGNYYHTVLICDQWWMAENLKTTKMNDGTSIDVIYGVEEEWWGHTNPTYCWYNHDISNKNVYGALYDWYAVTSGKLCPTGWHAPGDEEFQELADCLGGNAVAGGKLKETGTVHWEAPNTGATNESGFTGLPGGARNWAGTFSGLGSVAFFRSTAEHGDGAQGNGWALYSHGTGFNLLDWEREYSFSVRCVKDTPAK